MAAVIQDQEAVTRQVAAVFRSIYGEDKIPRMILIWQPQGTKTFQLITNLKGDDAVPLIDHALEILLGDRPADAETDTSVHNG